jgi:Hydrogenase maturation factor
VHELRTRKNRKDKPLAVMVKDLDAARKLCVLSEAEEKLLERMERPILLASARKDAGLAPGLSPDTEFLGIMLPYTPLHHVLFAELQNPRTSLRPWS